MAPTTKIPEAAMLSGLMRGEVSGVERRKEWAASGKTESSRVSLKTQPRSLFNLVIRCVSSRTRHTGHATQDTLHAHHFPGQHAPALHSLSLWRYPPHLPSHSRSPRGRNTMRANTYPTFSLPINATATRPHPCHRTRRSPTHLWPFSWTPPRPPSFLRGGGTSRGPWSTLRKPADHSRHQTSRIKRRAALLERRHLLSAW